MGESEELIRELADALKNALGAYEFYSPPRYPWEDRARATLAKAEAALDPRVREDGG